MEVTVPLCEVGSTKRPATASVQVSASDKASLGKRTRITHGGDGLFCVFDDVRAVVATVDAEEESFRVRGVFFFREDGKGCIRLSATRTLTELLDVREGFTVEALRTSDDTHVSVTSKTLLGNVDFVGSCVVFASRSGSVGCVSLQSLVSPKLSPLMGCLVGAPSSVTGNSGPWQWAMSRTSSPAILQLSMDRVIYYRLNGPSTVDVSELPFVDKIPPIDVAQTSSAACLIENDAESVSETTTILVTYRTTRQITVICLARVNDRVNVHRVDLNPIQHPLDLTVFPQPAPEVSLLPVGQSSSQIVALVYPDCVAFGIVVAGRFAVVAVLMNELSLSFLSGCWQTVKGHQSRFTVFRCDGICLIYQVTFDVVPDLRITEITVEAQFPIPFPVATCITTLNNRILAVKDVEGLLRDEGADADDVDSSADVADDSVAMLQERRGTDFRPLEGVECFCESDAIGFPSSMRILEVLSTPKGSYNILTVLDDGQCLWASTNQRGKQRIAREDDRPLDVTSCLSFQQSGETICVLGFRDGNVKTFIGDRVSCLVRMAHCGPVDRLVYFPNGGLDTNGDGGKSEQWSVRGDDGMTFVSISTQQGTICFHSGKKAEITKTVTSPSRPLTSCYVDRRSEYLFAFSNSTGNLWHLPTCRLERTFTHAGNGVLSRDDMSNLLEAHWESTVGINAFPFLGQIYYSVRIDVSQVVHMLSSTHSNSSDVKCALALLLRSCDVPADSGNLLVATLVNDALVNALADLSLGVSTGAYLSSCLGAIVISCAIAESSLETSIVFQAATLNLQLHASLLRTLQNTTTETEEHVLATYFDACFTRQRARASTTTLREGFTSMVTRLPNDAVEALAVAMLSTPPNTVTTRDSFGLLAAMLAARKAGGLMASANVLDTMRATAKEKCKRLMTVLGDTDSFTLVLTMADGVDLRGLAEGYLLFSELPSMKELLVQLVSSVFATADTETREMCTSATTRIMAADPVKVVHNVFDPLRVSHASWKPHMIIFLSRFTQAFPVPAASCFSTFLEFALRSASTSESPAMSSDERALCVDAMMQMVRIGMTHLPNVSFQQNLQQVAVGQGDGTVRVYHLKTGEVVSSFEAHQQPVIAVSYSSNTLSHDIATVSAKMECVKVFRSPKQTSSIVSFFTSATTQFKLETEVELPPVHTTAEEKALFSRFCSIKWLSPQCVEFSSPWHERILMTI